MPARDQDSTRGTRGASTRAARTSSDPTPSQRLSTYRGMRHADRTPEPMGDAKGKRRAPSASPTSSTFVIHEHHASSLHWDLRLEHEGVLVSWALPKGMPPTPEVNHLAVHTEDHPMEYGAFEGTIPEGEYGAGEVRIWDEGEYVCDLWSDREVKFELKGSRGAGHFALFATKPPAWMIHRHDPAPAGWTPLPSSIEPMLAEAGPLPKGEDWSFEFKWDGVRAVTTFDAGHPHARSRNGLDLTPSFPELRELGAAIGMSQVALDGELVAFDDDGRPDFGRIQQRLKVREGQRARRAAAIPVVYVIFDLLHVNGVSLLDLPYAQRRDALETLALNGDRWVTAPAFRDVDGRQVLEAAKRSGLEGVVAKRTTSPYRPGRRDPSWVKVKLERTQEVVVVGWTPGNGGRASTFGALLLAVNGDNGLVFVGKVGTGFTEDGRRALLARLEPLSRATSPLAAGEHHEKGAHWVRPSVVGEVRFTEWTGEGRLRHPTWRGLRPDKSANEVVREA